MGCTLPPTPILDKILEKVFAYFFESLLIFVCVKMFEILLAHRFENRRGHSMVVQKQFALEESCSGADIERHVPWSVAIRPGMKINMSMVFPKESEALEDCPRCRTKLDVPKRTGAEWYEGNASALPMCASQI